MGLGDLYTVRSLCCCCCCNGLTGWNRTSDPQLRRLLFYPLNYGQIAVLLLSGGPPRSRTGHQRIMSPLL